MLGNYLQQTPSADDILRCIVFLGALRVNLIEKKPKAHPLCSWGKDFYFELSFFRVKRIFCNILQLLSRFVLDDSLLAFLAMFYVC